MVLVNVTENFSKDSNMEWQNNIRCLLNIYLIFGKVNHKVLAVCAFEFNCGPNKQRIPVQLSRTCTVGVLKQVSKPTAQPRKGVCKYQGLCPLSQFHGIINNPLPVLPSSDQPYKIFWQIFNTNLIQQPIQFRQRWHLFHFI